ncbi:MAG TPA: diguanylate cyclase [Acidobacteriota bacterium]|nr:diguanylate cyclase [Acidobacteriota bacterium]
MDGTDHIIEQHIRVLLVEDTGDHAELISSFLRIKDQDIEIVIAESADEGIEKASSDNFDLILSDYLIGPLDCFDMLHELENRGISLPVIILTGQGNEEVAAEAIRRGADDYLIKENVFDEPVRLIRSIRSAVERSRLEHALRESEVQYRTLVQSMQDGLFVLRGRNFDFVNPALAEMIGSPVEELQGIDLVSLFLPEQRTAVDAFIEKAWDSEITQEREFILTGTRSEPASYVTVKLSKSIFNGQEALIGTVKDITRRRLVESKLRETLEKVELLSITDDLTGLFNRRHALSVADAEVARSHRYRHNLSLIMLDIDRFKEINDTFGHLMGDKMLKKVADMLVQELREIDTVARYGGDEFIIILPHTDIEQARPIAERLRKSASSLRLEADDGTVIKTTLSLGITQMSAEKETLTDLIRRADQAMLAAKSSGRDAVVSES